MRTEMVELGKILVVDSEPKTCNAIKELLMRGDYQVEACFSCSEALRLVKNNDYHMVIADLKMSGFDGLELIRKAKKIKPEILTIIVTGCATVESAVSSFRCGVDDYITKPFNSFELQKGVYQVFEKHWTERENRLFYDELRRENIQLDFQKRLLAKKIRIAGRDLTAANKKLVQKINEMATIDEISKVVTSELSVDGLLNLCLKQMNEKLKVKRSSIMLLSDDRKDELMVKICQGYKNDQILGKVQKVGKGIAGCVAIEKKPVLVRDVSREHRFQINQKADYITNSFISVPLFLDKKFFGVMNVTDKISGEDFFESDLNFLCTVANQISIALENAELYKAIEENCFNTVKFLANVLEAKDFYTSGHSQRVSEYASSIADLVGVSSQEKKTLNHAAQLHDIGKVGIPELILNKPDKLDESEFKMVQSHPIVGESIVEPLDFLKEAKCLIRGHHESFDGSGYPDKLGGDEIPILTKIMTIADAFDAITSKRIYRSPKKVDDAILELRRMSGVQFDPSLIDAFASSEIVKIKSDYQALEYC
ncbi:MAG: response regulator [Planctomycetes bacterium]|nr:response regulator [Planctomycetota bacterium]